MLFFILSLLHFLHIPFLCCVFFVGTPPFLFVSVILWKFEFHILFFILFSFLTMYRSVYSTECTPCAHSGKHSFAFFFCSNMCECPFFIQSLRLFCYYFFHFSFSSLLFTSFVFRFSFALPLLLM